MDSNVQIIIPRNRKGMVLVWVVMLMPVVLLFALIAVDFSYMYVAKGQLQNAADAAALAGAQRLITNDNSPPVFSDMTGASNRAIKFAFANTAAKQSVAIVKSSDITFGNWNVHYCPQYDGNGISLGTPGCAGSVNAIQVRAARDPASAGGPVPIIFGKYFGRNNMNTAAIATAAIPSRATSPIMMCVDFCQPGTNYPAMKNYTSVSAPNKPLLIGTGPCSAGVCQYNFAWISYDSNVTSASAVSGLVCSQNQRNLPVCNSMVYATMGAATSTLRDLMSQMYNPYYDSDNKDRFSVSYVNPGGHVVTVNTNGWWVIIPIARDCPPGQQGNGFDPKLVSRYAKVHISAIFVSGNSAGCGGYSTPTNLDTAFQKKYGFSKSALNNVVVIDKISCVDCSAGVWFSGLRPVLVSE